MILYSGEKTMDEADIDKIKAKERNMNWAESIDGINRNWNSSTELHNLNYFIRISAQTGSINKGDQTPIHLYEGSGTQICPAVTSRRPGAVLSPP
jgi:hypothetical protein